MRNVFLILVLLGMLLFGANQKSIADQDIDLEEKSRSEIILLRIELAHEKCSELGMKGERLLHCVEASLEAYPDMRLRNE